MLSGSGAAFVAFARLPAGPNLDLVKETTEECETGAAGGCRSFRKKPRKKKLSGGFSHIMCLSLCEICQLYGVFGLYRVHMFIEVMVFNLDLFYLQHRLSNTLTMPQVYALGISVALLSV